MKSLLPDSRLASLGADVGAGIGASRWLAPEEGGGPSRANSATDRIFCVRRSTQAFWTGKRSLPWAYTRKASPTSAQ
eukprot:15900530-Heterocapsa_arctica.AAC.1